MARKWLEERSYKSLTPAQQTWEQQTARNDLLDGLQSPQIQEHYGLTLDLKASLSDQIRNAFTADSLDALLCAIQAAWACSQQNYGLSSDCDPLEGWIVDPDMV